MGSNPSVGSRQYWQSYRKDEQDKVLSTTGSDHWDGPGQYQPSHSEDEEEKEDDDDDDDESESEDDESEEEVEDERGEGDEKLYGSRKRRGIQSRS